MRSYILSIVLLLSFSQAEATEELENCYELNHVEVLQIQHRISVYTRTTQGQERIKELKKDNYTCSKKPNQWQLCKKFMPKDFLPIDEIEKKSSSQPQEICILERRAEPTLITKTNSIVAWEYEQSIESQLWQTDKFELLVLPKLMKVKFSDKEEQRREYTLKKDRGAYQLGYVESLRIKADEGYFSIISAQNYISL